MINQRILKNIVGTVFLLVSGFLVCSSFISMRILLADPVQGVFETNHYTPVVMLNSNNSNSNRVHVNRPSRVSRFGGTATNYQPRVARSQTTNFQRNVSERRNISQDNIGRIQNQNTIRNVVSRSAKNQNVARISLQGNMIQGMRASANRKNNRDTRYNTEKNYSNIIDPSTGMIAAKVYSDCMESYYSCMDEICTARNASQRRCACAGRIKVFAEAERKLEMANEELIQASGQLALLLASKGKDVSSAFKLTDAEKVMNCVSYQDARLKPDWKNTETENGKLNVQEKWCYAHGIRPNGNTCAEPEYCDKNKNGGAFDLADLNGSGSDILSQLQSWAESKDLANSITKVDNGQLENVISTGLSAVNDTSLTDAGHNNVKDSLAETWGYDLFAYAHNNVCNRVLDSCFNGIYEACGTPPDNTVCNGGAGICPYNYNSIINVKNNGDSVASDVKFLEPSSRYTGNNTPACFGYKNEDPYKDLRIPVADARRSILNKYVLDANSDCDAYGEKIRKISQKIGYQKVAAQQMLQKKRLEFKQNEEKSKKETALTYYNNFKSCVKQLQECKEVMLTKHAGSQMTAIKPKCITQTEAPSCYEPMICVAYNTQEPVVYDVKDKDSCSQGCRNIVTLNEIITNTGSTNTGSTGDTSSQNLRHKCINSIAGEANNSVRIFF